MFSAVLLILDVSTDLGQSVVPGSADVLEPTGTHVTSNKRGEQASEPAPQGGDQQLLKDIVFGRC